MIENLVPLLKSEDENPYATLVAIIIINGLIKICSGIVCCWGFYYLANLYSLTPPGILESIGLVFVFSWVFQLLANLFGSIRLFTVGGG